MIHPTIPILEFMVPLTACCEQTRVELWQAEAPFGCCHPKAVYQAIVLDFMLIVKRLPKLSVVQEQPTILDTGLTLLNSLT